MSRWWGHLAEMWRGWDARMRRFDELGIDTVNPTCVERAEAVRRAGTAGVGHYR